MAKLLMYMEGPKLIYDVEKKAYVTDERHGIPTWEYWVFEEA